MKARELLIQKKKRKRIYLIIIISWSIRISKKKTTTDIFRLTDYLSYLSENSCYFILNFLFSYFNHSFIFFEYNGLIVLFRYFFYSTYLLFHSLFHSFSKPILDIIINI